MFGVFDRFHPGHEALLKQAKKYGDELLVVVARDSAVKELKGKKPKQNEQSRTRRLRRASGVNRVFLGDRKQGVYGVLKKCRPDLICLGYDQKVLRRDLEFRMKKAEIPKIPLVFLKSHQPKRFHSSFARS